MTDNIKNKVKNMCRVCGLVGLKMESWLFDGQCIDEMLAGLFPDVEMHNKILYMKEAWYLRKLWPIKHPVVVCLDNMDIDYFDSLLKRENLCRVFDKAWIVQPASMMQTDVDKIHRSCAASGRNGMHIAILGLKEEKQRNAFLAMYSLRFESHKDRLYTKEGWAAADIEEKKKTAKNPDKIKIDVHGLCVQSLRNVLYRYDQLVLLENDKYYVVPRSQSQKKRMECFVEKTKFGQLYSEILAEFPEAFDLMAANKNIHTIATARGDVVLSQNYFEPMNVQHIELALQSFEPQKISDSEAAMIVKKYGKKNKRTTNKQNCFLVSKRMRMKT